MKKVISKTLIFSSIFLSASIVADPEETGPRFEIDQEDPDICVPFPSCAQLTLQSNIEAAEELSEWSRFWQELTNDMQKKAQQIVPQAE